MEGSICFGRVLNNLTLEGKKGQDTARLSLVSDSAEMSMYIIKYD